MWIPIPSTSLNQFYVLIEGVRGNSEYGDIAIDDVAMIDGSCPETVSTEIYVKRFVKFIANQPKLEMS